MRRKEKEIKDKDEIEQIIRAAQVCRLAMARENQPYVIPLNFGYRDHTVYFHSASQGKKIDILRENPRVCLEFSIDAELVRAETSCEWGLHFKSAIGFGSAKFVEGPEEKKKALDIIMDHYGGTGDDYSEKMLNLTTVIKVVLTELTGKRSG